MSTFLWVAAFSVWALFFLPFLSYGVTIGIMVGCKRASIYHKENQNARS